MSNLLAVIDTGHDYPLLTTDNHNNWPRSTQIMIRHSGHQQSLWWASVDYWSIWSIDKHSLQWVTSVCHDKLLLTTFFVIINGDPPLQILNHVIGSQLIKASLIIMPTTVGLIINRYFIVSNLHSIILTIPTLPLTDFWPIDDSCLTLPCLIFTYLYIYHL